MPLLTVSASGGARMQEGMFSLLQMAKTSAAIQRLTTAGCLYISILGHPTTGGVFASFANLGDLIHRRARRLDRFRRPPRRRAGDRARNCREGSHTAEFLAAHGMIDAIVDRREQRDSSAAHLHDRRRSPLRLPAPRPPVSPAPAAASSFPPGTPCSAPAAPTA